jgi:hypothetical protein
MTVELTKPRLERDPQIGPSTALLVGNSRVASSTQLAGLLLVQPFVRGVKDLTTRPPPEASKIDVSGNPQDMQVEEQYRTGVVRAQRMVQPMVGSRSVRLD